jgi:hypothetical protein
MIISNVPGRRKCGRSESVSNGRGVGSAGNGRSSAESDGSVERGGGGSVRFGSGSIILFYQVFNLLCLVLKLERRGIKVHVGNVV